MKQNHIETVLMVITIIFTILFIVLAVWKLVGDSPTSEQVLFGLLGILTAWLFSLTYKFGHAEGRTLQFEKNVKESFERVRGELQEIKQKLK